MEKKTVTEKAEKIVWKGGTLEAPLPPVMVTCGNGEKANVLTIAWSGILNSDPPKTYISVRPSRYSYPIICESGEFVINLTTKDLVRAADYCGIYTGAKVDKFEKMHLETVKAHEVSCPLLAASPVSLECRVCDRIALGSHDMFIADIVAVDVDSRFIGQDGKLHLEKAGLCAFAHGSYFELGRKLGNIGFTVRKKGKGSSGK